jgi:methyl-accepting chemotaxis protein
MPPGPGLVHGDRPRPWSGMRWRFAGLTGALLLVADAVQGIGILLLHPEFTSRQLAGLAAVSLLTSLLGGGLAFWLTGALLRPLSRIRQVTAALASGRMPPPLDLAEVDREMGALARELDDFVAAIRRMLHDLRASAIRLTEESGGLLGGITRQGGAAAGQAEALRQATVTATAIADVTSEAAREAESVIVLTQRAEALSGQGLSAVEQAGSSAGALGEQVRRIAATMGDLSERTLQVGEIVASVKDLAEQSNLLALNASIEAAKAGEHGRGFAAVAMEMRNLAEQSRQAAVQVRSILGEIQKHAREAALATEEGSTRAELATGRSRSAGEAIEGLVHVIRGSAGSARTIADRTRQQAAGAAELVAAIATLFAATKHRAEDSAAFEAQASEITALAGRLSELSDRFRT